MLPPRYTQKKEHCSIWPLAPPGEEPREGCKAQPGAARSPRLDGLNKYTSAGRRGTRILKQFWTEIFSSRRPHFGHVVEKSKGTEDNPTPLGQWRGPQLRPQTSSLARKQPGGSRLSPVYLPFIPPGANGAPPALTGAARPAAAGPAPPRWAPPSYAELRPRRRGGAGLGAGGRRTARLRLRESE